MRLCADKKQKQQPAVAGHGQRETYIMEFTCPNCGDRYKRSIPKGTPAFAGTCPNCGCGRNNIRYWC